MKAAVLAALVAAGFVAQVGAANTVFFYARSLQLEEAWRSAEAGGVPGSALAPSRSALRSLDRGWAGTVPYAAVSGAALHDPFAALEAEGDQVAAASRSASRSRAEASLERLREAVGPNDRDYAEGLVALGSAREPADYARLAIRWEAQAQAFRVMRTELADSAGGLTDGLPSDVVQGVAKLQSLIAAATAAAVSSDPAWQTVVQAQLYLGQPLPRLLQAHSSVAGLLAAVTSTVQRRVNARQEAETALKRIPSLLPQALRYGIGDGYSSQVAALQQSFVQARTDDEMATVAANADALLRDLDAAGQGRLPLSGIQCIAGAPSKLIVIHLATQQLVAYDDGCPVLRTPVTTGRPALRTERGTFHIFLKARSWHMVSQWPQGSPFYYPPSWVHNAMEFIGDGTFIHNASWQPSSSYGPGSENGPYSSHGCIHVIDGPLAQLYDWAPVGTTVQVGD
jgi:lipoprotein-anchoring transpeptidase ErfK/SrfK